jgi:hypothetical protein
MLLVWRGQLQWRGVLPLLAVLPLPLLPLAAHGSKPTE